MERRAPRPSSPSSRYSGATGVLARPPNRTPGSPSANQSRLCFGTRDGLEAPALNECVGLGERGTNDGLSECDGLCARGDFNGFAGLGMRGGLIAAAFGAR